MNELCPVAIRDLRMANSLISLYDSIDSQAEARDQEIIGKDDRVTRLKYPGSDQHPGGLNISLSTPLSHLETTLVKFKQTSGDDTLILSAVVSRAHPGASETSRLLSLRTEGVPKQAVKADYVPFPAPGDEGNGDDVVLVLGNDTGDQRPQDNAPTSGSGADTASGSRLCANCRTPGGSPAAPSPAPKTSTPSLSAAVQEGTRRAATIITGEHGDDGSPGNTGRQSLRRSARRKTTPVKCIKETAGDDMLHVSSVVSRAHPGGSDEMRLPPREEGLSTQEIKGEDVPDDVARLPASGDQGPRADAPPSDSASDSEDEEPQQDSTDPDYEAEDSEEEEEEEEEDTVQRFSSRRTRATSGRRSSAVGGTSGGISAAAPPPTPKASSSFLPIAVHGVIRSTATRQRGKRKQPDGEEERPSSSVGMQHPRIAAARRKGRATTTDLPVSEESQTQQEGFTRDTGGARKRCECGSHRPTFGLPGASSGLKAARWCSQCPSKPKHAVDVRNKRCDCGRHQPTFGPPGAPGLKAAQWCSQCPSKPKNAVDVVNKRCECGSHIPTFGPPGGSGRKDAWWCCQCPSKPNNAVNVVSKRCECGSRQPSFGLPGAIGMKDARWCSQCPYKPNNAVDVVNKICECGSHIPIFGPPGAFHRKAARWCSQCPSKPNNAVNVVTKRCECGSHVPTFGLPGGSGLKDSRWCLQCPSKPNNAVDVRSKRCECGSRQPSLGLPGTIGRNAAKWCSQCPSKPNNAVCVKNKKMRVWEPPTDLWTAAWGGA